MVDDRVSDLAADTPVDRIFIGYEDGSVLLDESIEEPFEILTGDFVHYLGADSPTALEHAKDRRLVGA